MRAEHTGYLVPGWGRGDLWTGGGLVLAHELEFERGAGEPGEGLAGSVTGVRSGPPGARPPAGAELLPARTLSDPEPALPGPGQLDPAALVERFLAFFDGCDESFADVPIDLEWATPFQASVAAALRRLPRGEVVSYGELASLAGYRGAGRAVGTFCARNRFMLLLPCHRVVGASGLGGYGSAGIGVKRRLLALEGVRL